MNNKANHNTELESNQYIKLRWIHNQHKCTNIESQL